ncbi:MAG: hydrolase 1, exosortase system-associated [Rhodoferax sp.]|nr:hydrolase 1, exosortase system-associated [Rhodoferax sp.]
MNYAEEPLVFTCADETLVGILSAPASDATTGVVIVVGGPQYRAGSHRQFVRLARTLASAGHAALRFDYRGMGDSSGNARDFLNVTQDIRAAIEALQRRLPTVSKIVLWGLCDGASAALLYCRETQDQRIAGLCLVNPWVRSEASLARTQVKHYYAQRLMQREFWLKLMSGKVAAAALSGLVRSIRLSAGSAGSAGSAASAGAIASNASFQQRMAEAWHSFQGSILLLLSGDDYTAKEFVEYAQTDTTWSAALKQAKVVQHVLDDADHTFSDHAARTRVEDLTRNWLDAQVHPTRNPAGLALAP